MRNIYGATFHLSNGLFSLHYFLHYYLNEIKYYLKDIIQYRKFDYAASRSALLKCSLSARFTASRVVINTINL